MPKKSKIIITAFVAAVVILVGAFALKALYINSSSRSKETTVVSGGQIRQGDTESVVLNTQEIGLPENFPSDFPIYEEAVLTDSWSAEGSGSQGLSVVWGANDKPEKIYEFYKLKLKSGGWNTITVSESEGSYTLSFEKADLNGFMGITKDTEASKTIISVTIGLR